MLSNTVVSFLALGSMSLVFALDSIPVVGAPVQNGVAPIRRDINDLASEAGPQWDLYVQSLTAMYEAKSSDPLSFFQVAGIHGWPFVEWNGTGAGRENDDWNGYCPHGEPIFLAWHRPYVVLFEQVLVGHAKQIAARYPEDRRKEYTEAAATLRAPFWDWASTRAVPESTVPESVSVNTAEGKKQIKNPLASYSYPEEALQGRYGDLDSLRPEARRQPRTYRCTSPQSYPDSANDALSLRSNQIRVDDLRAMVYDVFTTSQTFDQFASTRDIGSSLEQIHNSIHIEAACVADLSNQRVASYEPLFMLHHANVDRLWAYWQVVNPDKADFSGSYSGGARFTTPSGTTINPDSPLEPFLGQGGRPHTSKTVASIRSFGYSYEGLEGDKSSQQMKDDATSLINRLYSGNAPPEPAPPTGPRPSSTPSGPRPSGSPGSPRPSGTPRPGNSSSSPGVRPTSSNPSGPRPSSSPNGPRPGNPYTPGYPSSGDGRNGTDYSGGDGGERQYALIQLDVTHLERPCFINVYVGDIHAGSMVAMGQPARGIVNGAILLNRAIRGFANQPANATSREFSNNIHVDITKGNGTRIALSSVASLKIQVNRVNVSPPASDNELPKVEFKEPEPVNGGRELTPPPASTRTDYGPRIDGGGDAGRSGGGAGSGEGSDGGKKPKSRPSAAAPRSGLLSGFVLVLFAIISLSLVL